MSSVLRVAFVSLLLVGGVVDAVAQPAARRPGGVTQTPATQGDNKRILRLGTREALYRPVRTIVAVRRMAESKVGQQRIAAAMDAAGLTALTAQVMQVLTAASESTLQPVQIQPGTKFEFMAFRDGGRKVVAIQGAEWAGRAPFGAWQFTVEDDNTKYTFLVPQPCANLSLAQRGPSAAAIKRQQDEEARQRAEQDRLARERADQERRAREEADRQKAEQDRMAKERADQDRAAREEADRQRAEQERLEKERLAREAREKIDWFVAGFFGKERRVREIETADEFNGGGTAAFAGSGLEAGFCSPLVGVKGGVDIRMNPSWRVAPAVGLAINTDQGDWSSLFAEVEFNRQFERAFVGTGVGVWDFNHSDSVAPTWLVHFGREVWRSPNEHRLFVVAEGRLFLNELDNIESNYQFWGGLRYVIR